MMIVAVIAVSVVAFTPGFTRAMADRRVSSAARELIRIGRRARSDTFGYLRAHMVWINSAAGRVQLLRGPTNSCRLPTAWATIANDCTLATPGRRCLEDLVLSSLGGTMTLRRETATNTYAADNVALCYAPNGVVSHATGSDLASAMAAGLRETNCLDTTPSATCASPLGGGYVFALVNGSEAPSASNFLRIHRVLFPLGGTARSLR